MSQATMRVRGKAGAEGVRASKDGARDNWRTPKWLMDVLHEEHGSLWDASGRINVVRLRLDVELWLLPVRVAYEPPPGIAASSPTFDSCVVVRGER